MSLRNVSPFIYKAVSSGSTVPRQAPAQCGSASGPPIVCGFLTSCRKDFTARVQVILRVRLLRLGTVKQRKDLGWQKEQERAWAGLLWLPRKVVG